MNVLMVDGLQPVRYPGEVLPWQQPVPVQQPRLLAPALPVSLPQQPTRHLARLIILVVVGVVIASSIGYIVVTRATLATSKPLTAATTSTLAKTSTFTPTPATSAASTLTATQIQQTLDQFVASTNTPFYILVRNLTTGATASVKPDQVTESASLYKLFVANQVYLLADKGRIDLNSATGDGVDTSVNQCLNNMITWSDNTCGLALGARIGWQAQAGSLAQQGITQTDLKSDPTRTNVNDVATLYENLYAGKYLSPASTTAFLALLKDQKVNNRLPQGLPAGTTIAHKTGDLDGFMHDAGIVYGPKANYLIVAMSGPWNNQNNSFAAFSDLSQKIYQQLEQ